jgi:hypothetical protein
MKARRAGMSPTTSAGAVEASNSETFEVPFTLPGTPPLFVSFADVTSCHSSQSTQSEVKVVFKQ